jgi:Domain of unknown function (DUF4307)
VTETYATPVFPAGRYGRRRNPRPGRRLLRAALFGLVIAVGVVVALQLTRQYGAGRPYDPAVQRFYDVTDRQVVVEFTVRIPEGEAGICVVRARGADGAEVGREEVRVDPPPGIVRPTLVHRLATTARPVTGEVQRCWRANPAIPASGTR